MKARHVIAVVVVSMVFVGVVRSADPPAKAPAKTAKTAKTAKKPPEVMDGAVDPFLATSERAKFFTAAGPDSELSAEEHAASKGKSGAFARKFDTFAGMLAFDKNRNKTIDWFEAKAYREDLRRRVFVAFDANKDGQLKGEERDKANRALAAGKVPGGSTGRSSILGRSWQPSPEMIKQHDADKDGKLNDEERGAMRKARTEQYRKERDARYDTNKDGKVDDDERAAGRDKAIDDWLARSHDKNKDGQLDEEEAAAMQTAKTRITEARQRWQKLRTEMTAKHDVDKDGKLNDAERREMWKDVRKQSMVSRFDKDKDGQLNEEEAAALKEAEDQQQAMYQEWQKAFTEKYDTDGDGELSKAEREVAQAEIRKEFRQLADDWRAKWDVDGDGELSPDERQAMGDGLRKRGEELRKEIDANQDGTTSPQELQAFMQKLRKVYDVNEDGRLSMDELKAMIKDQIGRMGPKRRPKE